MSKHFLDLSSFSLEKLSQILHISFELKKIQQNNLPSPVSTKNRSVALVFLEPSTRTRMSFEMAAHAEGYQTSFFDGGNSTSFEKGETAEDTLFNIAAMNPAAIVLRCQDQVNIKEISKKLHIPILNGGWGKTDHPSQAMLDLMTIKERFVDLKNVRLLLLGDVRHSRVAGSHLQAAQIFGHQVACCGPESFMLPGVKSFTDLASGLKWANVVMALRVQFERHSEKIANLQDSYVRSYSLNSNSIKDFSAEGLIMHPGPINYGIEMDIHMQNDPRNAVLTQVTNGVYVRRALIQEFAK